MQMVATQEAAIYGTWTCIDCYWTYWCNVLLYEKTKNKTQVHNTCVTSMHSSFNSFHIYGNGSIATQAAGID